MSICLPIGVDVVMNAAVIQEAAILEQSPVDREQTHEDTQLHIPRLL